MNIFSIDDNVLYLTDPLYIPLLFFVFNNSADAHEFFGLMREMLLKEVSPSEGNVTISNHPHDPKLYRTIENFWKKFDSGKIQQKITCLGCNNVSVTTTPFLTLILQFPVQQFHEEPLDMRKAISITNLIEHFLSKQDDELTNYECNNCPTRQRATKTYVICHYPEILCIVIGRKRNDYSVIENPVQYPFTGLELTNIDASIPPCYFKLFAAVNHQPSSEDKGHYTAVTRDHTTNTWFEYDDDNVQRIKFQGRLKNFSSVQYQRMASILFYEMDPNYSHNNTQFSLGTNEALNQDYTANVISIRQNEDNKKRKYGDDHSDINDNDDDNMARNDTHNDTEQSSDSSSYSDSTDSNYTFNHSAKKNKREKNILTFQTTRAKTRPRRSESERYSNLTQRKFG